MTSNPDKKLTQDSENGKEEDIDGSNSEKLLDSEIEELHREFMEVLRYVTPRKRDSADYL